MKRYEIRRADRTPVVIVSLDALNEMLSTVTVCPLTTQLRPAWRTRLGVRAGSRNAEITLDQIRTIGKSRIGKKLGALTQTESSTLRRIITEMYGE